MSAEVKTPLAVALHYDRTGAPRVVAKGKGLLAADELLSGESDERLTPFPLQRFTAAR